MNNATNNGLPNFSPEQVIALAKADLAYAERKLDNLLDDRDACESWGRLHTPERAAQGLALVDARIVEATRWVGISRKNLIAKLAA